MNIRIHNNTDKLVYTQKKCIQPGKNTMVFPDVDGKISMYCADRFIKSVIGLYYDLNISDIVIVDDINKIRNTGKFGIAYVDFTNQYIKAGDPIRPVAYPIMFQVGSFLGN